MEPLKIAGKSFSEFIPVYDEILSRGLCGGVGSRDSQMCIEAAICASLDLPHGDDPECVSRAVRAFKIALNDLSWDSPRKRAEGLRALGIAQLGSKGVVDDREFVIRLLKRLKDIDRTNYGLENAEENLADDFPICAAECLGFAGQSIGLIVVANEALEVLKELKSPGCEWLSEAERKSNG